MAEVQFEGVSKRFGETVAVRDVSLRVDDGAFLSLLGPSGCGKTTMLRLVAGFVRLDEGVVRIGGQPMNDVPPHRRNIGMVFQSYALFPHMSVFDNVAFGLAMRGTPRPQIEERVRRALRMVRLEGLQERFPNALSGGQQQRVAIARSIAIAPAVLLLDEPLSALDKKLREEMQTELRQLQRELGITTLYVTHDQQEAYALSDRIAVVHQGSVVQHGAPAEIYEQPSNAFVADFIGIPNLFDAVVSADDAGLRAQVGATTIILGPREGVAPGRAKIAIRSDRIQLRDSSSPYAGVVIGKTYLGGQVRLRIRLTIELTIVADAPTTDSAHRRYSEGDDVFVAWRPQDVLVVGG